MNKKIEDKLNKYLVDVPKTEERMVYILVKIRKIIERDKKKKEYTGLKFYCDFVLHTKIDQYDNKEEIKRIIQNMINDEYPDSLIGFKHFHTCLEKFLEEYNLNNFYENCSFEDMMDLIKLLNKTFSDSKLEIKINKQKNIVSINESGVITFQLKSNL